MNHAQVSLISWICNKAWRQGNHARLQKSPIKRT